VGTIQAQTNLRIYKLLIQSFFIGGTGRGAEPACPQKPGRLPVCLLVGPVPNDRELDALTIQRADHTPKPYEENKQRCQTH
jgi:hypothetical protein